MKRPSFQFYPADWRRDAALQSCSVSARGLWIELMCVMHDCEPYGVLAVNGRAMSPAQLARLVGEQEKVIVRLLAELEDAGVCSRDEEGRLFSRRMVKDEGVREARAAGGHAGAEHGHKGGEHGKKGGRPRKAEAGSSGEEKTPLKPTLKTTLATIEEPPPSSSSSSSSSPSGNEEAKASLSPSAKSPAGSALPKNWILPAQWAAWAQGERPDLDPNRVADEFRDYWIAKPGKEGRKADWEATWRNWVRNQRATTYGRPAHSAAPRERRLVL